MALDDFVPTAEQLEQQQRLDKLKSSRGLELSRATADVRELPVNQAGGIVWVAHPRPDDHARAIKRGEVPADHYGITLNAKETAECGWSSLLTGQNVKSLLIKLPYADRLGVPSKLFEYSQYLRTQTRPYSPDPPLPPSAVTTPPQMAPTAPLPPFDYSGPPPHFDTELKQKDLVIAGLTDLVQRQGELLERVYERLGPSPDRSA